MKEGREERGLDRRGEQIKRLGLDGGATEKYPTWGVCFPFSLLQTNILLRNMIGGDYSYRSQGSTPLNGLKPSTAQPSRRPCALYTGICGYLHVRYSLASPTGRSRATQNSAMLSHLPNTKIFRRFFSMQSRYPCRRKPHFILEPSTSIFSASPYALRIKYLAIIVDVKACVDH